MSPISDSTVNLHAIQLLNSNSSTCRSTYPPWRSVHSCFEPARLLTSLQTLFQSSLLVRCSVCSFKNLSSPITSPRQSSDPSGSGQCFFYHLLPVHTLTLASPSVATTDSNSTFVNPICHHAAFMPSPPAAVIRSLDAQPMPLTENQLSGVVLSQILLLADIVHTHMIQNTSPDDVADGAGRRLMQSRGVWLVHVTDAIEVPTASYIRLL